MNYLQNHIWCSSSIWDGKHYDCRHLVSISAYKDYDVDNWKNVIEPNADMVINESSYNILKNIKEKCPNYDEDAFLEASRRPVLGLKPHVLQWLHTNVEDRPQQKTSEGESLKGWCIGSPKYRGINESAFTVFFYRKKDAMKFIKEFSEYKKPVIYCQKFSDVRKKLDLNTRKYTIF